MVYDWRMLTLPRKWNQHSTWESPTKTQVPCCFLKFPVKMTILVPRLCDLSLAIAPWNERNPRIYPTKSSSEWSNLHAALCSVGFRSWKWPWKRTQQLKHKSSYLRQQLSLSLQSGLGGGPCWIVSSLLMEELSEVDTRPVLRVEVRGTAGQVHVKVGAWVDLVMGNGFQFLCVWWVVVNVRCINPWAMPASEDTRVEWKIVKVGILVSRLDSKARLDSSGLTQAKSGHLPYKMNESG